MMPYPEFPEDTVLYAMENIYGTEDITIRMLNYAKLNIWGEFRVNNTPVLGITEPYTYTPAYGPSPADGANIIIGFDNEIASDLGTAAILGGGSPNYENVIGGSTANVNTPASNLPAVAGSGGDWAAIIAGYDNVNNGDASQISGYHCKIEAAATHATIGGGSLHSITAGDYGTVGGGTQNSTAANQSTIGGGSINVIQAAATRGTISGGGDNLVSGYGGTISGGEQHQATATGATVSGGVNNDATNNYATVGGGQNHIASGQYSVIAGGTGNQVTANQSSVGGGTGNQATGVSATVSGGQVNVAGPGTAATVVGGRENTASAAHATAVGREASANLEGALTQSSGKFAAVGDAQVTTLVVRNQTTDATVTELFLNGSSSRMALLPDSTWAFDIMVVGRNTTAAAESAAYSCRGCIDRQSGGTTRLVGTAPITVVAEDIAAWDCVVDADIPNGALRIRVTGEAAKIIRWVGRVNLIQVLG